MLHELRRARLSRETAKVRGFLASIDNFMETSPNRCDHHIYKGAIREIFAALSEHLSVLGGDCSWDNGLDKSTFRMELTDCESALGPAIRGVVTEAQLLNIFGQPSANGELYHIKLLGVIEMSKRDRDEQYRYEARGL